MPNNKIQDYIFYKIVCLDNSCNELCYVGSTANWKARNRCHKYDCTNENSKSYNSKKYQTIREHGGWDNFKMVEIGKAEQLTKRQAEMVEEEYRQELRANMNSQRCYTTDEEKREHDKRYREDNKDKILEQNKQYNQNNKDKIKQYREENRDKIAEQRKQYYENNSDKIAEKTKQYRENNRDKILEYLKQYRMNNPNKILEYQKEYRENNSDKIREYQKEKITCECGCIISRNHKSDHLKTDKHKDLMSTKN